MRRHPYGRNGEHAPQNNTRAITAVLPTLADEGTPTVNHANEAERTCVGFLSVLRVEEEGYLGGYLVLDRHGHPLSFHFTEPVLPNRVQQILYGAQLEPYLLGRRIGAVLVEKGRPRPGLVLTDRQSVLAAAQVVDVPLAWVMPPEEAPRAAQAPEAEPPRQEKNVLAFRRWHLLPAEANSTPPERLLHLLEQLDPALELDEPFQRIALALEEARRAA